MNKDRYKSISTTSQGEYREKGSKFFCYLFPVSNKSDIDKALDGVKKEHPKARHFCSAYLLGIDGEPSMVNDDGEPSGSAGRPILGQLRSFEISDVYAVVVRYFGGTKLGISGLIHAYKTSTKAAIEANEIIEKVLMKQFELSSSYEHMGHLLACIKKTRIELLDKKFENEVILRFELPLSEVESTLHQLNAHLLKIKPSELSPDIKADFVDITEIE